MGLVGDQHGIRCFHDHGVVEANRGKQSVVGGQVRVAGADRQHVALHGVAVRVCRVAEHIRQRPPGTHVAPCHVRWHHDAARRLLHHGVVDGVRRARKECAAKVPEIPILACVRNRTLAGSVDVRPEPPQFFQVDARLGHEDAAVPVVAASLQIAVRGIERRLLHESRDLGAAVGAQCTGADVPVARLRARRHDAKCDDAALFGERQCAFDAGAEGGDIADVMIRRQGQQRRVPRLHQMQRRDGKRRCGIARLGLQ